MTRADSALSAADEYVPEQRLHPKLSAEPGDAPLGLDALFVSGPTGGSAHAASARPGTER
jgi:hypothetical protein